MYINYGIIKKARHISATILCGLLVLTAAVIYVFQLPRVQNAMLKKLLVSVNEIIPGNISFGEFRLQPFNTIILTDLLISDPDPVITEDFAPQDTVIAAKTVILHFSIRSLLSEVPILHRGIVEDGQVNLVFEEEGINITRIFPKPQPEEKQLLSFSNIETDNFKVRMFKVGKAENIDITALLHACNFIIKKNGVKGTIKKFRAIEKRGYSINDFATKLRADVNGIEIKDFHFNDGMTNLNIPALKMDAGEIPVFEGRISGSHLSSRSAAMFIPEAEKLNIELGISNLELNGPLDDLSIDKFIFSEGRGISGRLDLNVKNLPDIEGAVFNMGISDVVFPLNGDRLNFTGKIYGPVNSLKAEGKLNSGYGSASADVTVQDILRGNAIGVHGNVQTKDINIGHFIGNDKIAECTVTADIDASIKKDDNHIRLNSLKVDRLNVLGYDYSGIAGAGTFSDDAFDGRIICSDPNLNFIFQGIFNLSKTSRNALYKFYFNLAYADLKKLNLDKKHEVSRGSFELNADYMRLEEKDLIGTIDILDLNLEDENGVKKIGDIHINSHSNDDIYRANFESSFANATYVGSKQVIKFIDDLQNISLKKHLSALYPAPAEEWPEERYEASVSFHDTRDILSFLVPGAYIADSTRLSINVSRDGELRGLLSSPRLAVKGNYMKDLRLDIDNGSGSLNGKLRSKENKLGGFITKDNSLIAFAQENELGLSFDYLEDNGSGNKSNILLAGELSRDDDGKVVLDAGNLESTLYFNNHPWTIHPANYRISSEGFRLDSLMVDCGNQSMMADGMVSKTRTDTLSVEMDKFDLGMLVAFLGSDIEVSGLATGKAMLMSPTGSNLDASADFLAENLAIYGTRLGEIRLNGGWNKASEKFEIAASNKLDGTEKMAVAGSYDPAEKGLDINAGFNGFDLAAGLPFVKEIFSEVGGSLSGELAVDGTTDNIGLSGKGLTLKDGLLKVAYTNVQYHLDGPLMVDNEGIHFNNVAMSDNHSGKGVVSGGIGFKGGNINVDTRIDFENAEVLNTGINSEEGFYGNIFGTGNVRIFGPLGAITVDGEASTTSRSNFHLALGNAIEDGRTATLTFKQPEKHEWIDPYLLMMKELDEEQKNDETLQARLKVHASPALTCFLDFDKIGETTLKGNGNGTIGIDVDSKERSLNLSGDYTLTNGNYHLSVLGITDKDFAIKDGSAIRFNGPVMDTELDINATYTTRTSVSNLIADTTAVSVRRAVECGLHIFDKLRNPQLEFQIDVPDLDPSTKTRVESALNTEDKLQRQFLSLLVTNSFLPDEQSGVVNSSNLIYSNVSQLMSNQLNNILQKLNIPLDMGLSYQANEGGTNIFDVAISTQLFNNRVIVNGAIGNRQYTNNSTQDVVGDLDIEVKMDKAGALRMTFFSHSADDHTNYLDHLQRNGLGVAYQKEFNSLKELFGNIFKKKEDKEQ